jgi:hypothetical protein
MDILEVLGAVEVLELGTVSSSPHEVFVNPDCLKGTNLFSRKTYGACIYMCVYVCVCAFFLSDIHDL